MSRLKLKLMWLLFGQFLENFGYFLFQHLVTLDLSLIYITRSGHDLDDIRLAHFCIISSVTRCWNTKLPKISQKLPKSCHCSFVIKQLYFSKKPNKPPRIRVTFVRNFVAMNFQISPIWSHWWSNRSGKNAFRDKRLISCFRWRREIGHPFCIFDPVFDWVIIAIDI